MPDVGGVEVLSMDHAGDMQRVLQRVAATLYGDRNRLVLVKAGALVHLFPSWIVGGIEAAITSPGCTPAWAAAEPLVTHSTAVVLTSTERDLIDPTEIENHEDKGQNEVGKRSCQPDQHSLPARMRGERTGIVRRLLFAGSFAGHFDVAAQRQAGRFCSRYRRI